MPEQPTHFQEIVAAREIEPVAVSTPTKEQLRGYKEWKQQIPPALRSLVEGHLLGRRARIETGDLPSVTDFYNGMRRLLQNPQADVSQFEIAEIARKQLVVLQKLKFGEDRVNLFAALADPNIGFDIKANYVRSKLIPRLDFLRARERQELKKAIEAHGETDVTGEEEQEEYSPHRAPEQEGEGLPSEAVATVVPFYGGYFMDNAYDRYDPATLTWKKSKRRVSGMPEQRLDTAKTRLYCSRVKNGNGKVKLPRGWGANRQSVKWSGDQPSDWKIEHDQDGIVRIVLSDGKSGAFSIEAAPSPDAINLALPEGEVEAISDRFPQELLNAAQEVMRQNTTEGAKARRVASIIHKHLEYDKDPKWEAVYKADPARYFEAIWENKKAKCDEANSLLVRLLTKLGLHARFVGGHSVRTKSEAVEAMLLESNRHAWAYAWDAGAREWIRLDSTPAGDPNVDQDEQQADLGEGDYGEQEAECMSEKELDKRLEEMEREEQERRQEEDPVLKYAKEAECSPEEARAVLEKIDTLRKRYARVLSDANRQWQTLVRENVRELIVDRGPVALSKMDEIDPDELVSGYVEIMAGEKDPLIGEREESERKKEKWFGGYEVYVVADMSGSMNETFDGMKKADAQRDMAFLMVDSCMSAAVAARKSDYKLKAPMPVKVSVVVLGVKTEIVLPLTEDLGPKEQITLYRALDAGAGGGTPDHAALALVEQQVAVSLQEQNDALKKKLALRKHGWGMRRFVIATADGGSDSPGAVKLATGRLQEMGIPVDLFLIAPEDDVNLKKAAEAAYPSVTQVSDVGELAQKGLKRLTERIKEAYGK